jgi:MoaA/NifB/PqqE/SkfB family radical SAM enzyme
MGAERGATAAPRSAAEWAKALAPLAPRSLRVYFDLSNKCNIRCRQCYFSYDSFFYRKAVFLKPDLFGRIAARVLPFARTVLLSAGAEPLTSPYFPDILDIVAQYAPPEVLFLTNGLLLTPALADAVVEHQVSAVHFSVDGATRATYEHIRRGGNFDRLRRNIAYLAERKRLRESRLPKLVFNITLMRSNVEELGAFVDLAQELGVSEIGGRHVAVFEGLGMQAESLVHDKRRANECFHAMLEKAARAGIVVTNFPDYFRIDARPWTPPAPTPTPAAPDDRGSATRRPLPLVPDEQPAAAPPPSPAADGPCPVPVDAAGARAERPDPAPRPFGHVDCPEEQAVHVTESAHFSGWALDALGVVKVELRRAALPGDAPGDVGPDGLVPLGEAGFRNGARPDVAALYPRLPHNYRAGWTFELRRPPSLADEQQPLRVSVFAENLAGERAELGSRVVTFGPAQSARPYLFCPHVFNSVYIDPNGDLFPYPDCHTAPFGSFTKDVSFEDVWAGEAFAELRRRVIERDPPEMCRRCTIFINRRVEDGALFLDRPVRDSSSLPTGCVDQPADGAECGGLDLEFSGWAFSVVGVERVEVRRDPVSASEPAGADGRVPVGEAVFGEGTRPDIIALYGRYADCRRAGWAYRLRRDQLPGAGPFRFHVVAVNAAGGTVLGTRTVSFRRTPVGYVEHPADGCECAGADLVVSGWAVGLVGVERVEIRREPVSASEPVGADGRVFVGEADFREGTRPDVAALYGRHADCRRAGWAYRLHRNQLPGAGPFRFHVVAVNAEGTTVLGTRTVSFRRAGVRAAA